TRRYLVPADSSVQGDEIEGNYREKIGGEYRGCVTATFFWVSAGAVQRCRIGMLANRLAEVGLAVWSRESVQRFLRPGGGRCSRRLGCHECRLRRRFPSFTRPLC